MADEKTVAPDEGIIVHIGSEEGETVIHTNYQKYCEEIVKATGNQSVQAIVDLVSKDDSITDKAAFFEIYLDLYLYHYSKALSKAFREVDNTYIIDLEKKDVTDEEATKLVKDRITDHFSSELRNYCYYDPGEYSENGTDELEVFVKAVFNEAQTEYWKSSKQKEQEKIDKRLEANPDDPLDDLGSDYVTPEYPRPDQILVLVDDVSKTMFSGRILPFEARKIDTIYPVRYESGKKIGKKNFNLPLDILARRDYGTAPIPLNGIPGEIFYTICSLFDDEDKRDMDSIVATTAELIDRIARQSDYSTTPTLQELTTWIDVLTHQRFYLDEFQLEAVLRGKGGFTDDEISRYKKYFSTEKPLLEAYRKYSIVPGGDNTRKNSKAVVYAYSIRKPALMVFAEIFNRISRSKLPELQARTDPTALNGGQKVRSDFTKAGIALYISTRINNIRAFGGERRILFETLYKEFGITGSKEKAQARKYAFQYLDTQAHTSDRITGFKVVLKTQNNTKLEAVDYEAIAKKHMSTRGKIFYAVDIVPGKEWLDSKK